MSRTACRISPEPCPSPDSSQVVDKFSTALPYSANLTPLHSLSVPAVPEGSPRFTAPPVNEVALAVAFETIPLDVYELSDIGRAAFSASYPDVSVRPPVTPTEEPVSFIPAGPLNFELVTGAPQVRLWFRSVDRTQLVQFQDDWISCNWQDADTEAEYPKYRDAIRPFFLDNIAALTREVTARGIGEVLPVQCEVSYINHIEPGDLWTGFGDVHRVMKGITPFESFLGAPEGVEMAMHFPLLDRGGEPRGRLHMSLQPAFRATDKEPVLVMTLTGRGRPLDGNDGVIQFMDLAHDWIVNGFTELVSDEALTAWGFSE